MIHDFAVTEHYLSPTPTSCRHPDPSGSDDVRIVVDFPWWSSFGLGPGAAPARGALTRATLDPARGAISLEHPDQAGTEFPRIDDRLTGRRHRYLTVGGVSGRHELVRGEHDQLVRYDKESGTSTSWDCEGTIGEVVFAPRAGGTEELDGY